MNCSTWKVDGGDEDVEHLSLLYRMKVMTIVSPDELLQRATGLDHEQPGGRHRGAQTVAWRSAGVGQGDNKHIEIGFIGGRQLLERHF